MRIDEVRATAFGPYRDEALTLSPGMNIFHGPNETGKSSWFAALYAGLAGQRKPRANSSIQTDFASRHRPWTGSQWAAGVVVTMADGTRLAFSHDLRSGESTISEPVEGRDLSVEELETRYGLQLTTDSVLDGTRLLGLNRHSARATTYIGQADVLRVLSDAEELHEAMERAAASVSEGLDAEAALAWLENARRHLEDPAALERLRTDATAATTRSQSQLDALNDVIGRERATFRDRELAQRDLELVRSIDQWVQINRLKPRLASARHLQAQIDDKAGPRGPVDDEQIRNAIVVLGAYDRLDAAPSPPVGPTAEAIRAEIADLPPLPVGDLTPSPAATSAHTALLVAQQAVTTHAAAEPAEPEDFPDQFTAQELGDFADLLETEAPQVDEDLRSERSLLLEAPADEAELDRAWVRYHERVERNTAKRKEHKAALKHHAKAEKVHRKAEGRTAPSMHHVLDEPPSAASAWQLPVIFGLILVAEIAIFVFVSNALGLAIGVLGIIGLLLFRRTPDEEATAPPEPGPAPEEPDYEPEVQPDETPQPVAKRAESPRLVELDALIATAETEAAQKVEERDRLVKIIHDEGIEPTPAGLRALAQQLKANAVVAAGHQAHEDQSTKFIMQRDLAASRLAGVLQHDVIAPLDQGQVTSIFAAYDEYVAACGEREKIAALATRRAALVSALAEREQRELDYRIATEQRRRGEDEIKQVATQFADWDSSTTVTATESATYVRSWIRAQEAARAESGVRAELSARLDQLLEGSTVGALADKIAILEASAGVEPPTVPEDLYAFRRHVNERHDQVIERLGDLRGQRAGLGQALTAPAQLLEVQREGERHAARCADYRSLLNATESELRLARDRARANIAPAVEARIRPWLPRVTRGRYVDATVSPDELKIKVTDQQGQVREAELLSQGTTEQVFLLLRVALAQVLGGGTQESAPIILDDVTVQSDQVRTFAILELLHELSADHQVVLFTQELEVINWALEHLDRDVDQVMALTPASDLGHTQRTLF